MPGQDERMTHERLDVYQIALEFVAIAAELVRKLPRAKGRLGDQLERASEAIVLGIAEGASADTGSAEQRRYFRAARGSVLECAAALDICRLRAIGSPERLARGRILLVRLVKILTRMAQGR